MKRIAYRLLAAISKASARVRTGALARPCRAKRGRFLRLPQLSVPLGLLGAALVAAGTAAAAARPHYGGTLRVMMQSAPNALELSSDATPSGYWDAARVLSLIGDPLVTLDPQARPQPALAVAWQSDAGARHWQFTLRRGVKFHDGSAASPAAVAQVLGALHPRWKVRASADSVLIESETAIPSLLAELALPRNLLLKRSANGVPVGTGAFVVAGWQPGKLLQLAANEESWAGRPFVDAVEIQFGKALRDQAVALELDKTDVMEAAPFAANGSHAHGASASLSLPVELMALVFSPNSQAQDPRLREALALAVDRKPIQAALLKGAGEPAATILPNWMTGYGAVFSVQANPQRARTLLAESRQPALNLSYDPRDPQAQLIAERIALNAREAGITVQVSLSGAEDVRLVRVALPSPDPAASLAEAARQLGLPPPLFSMTPGSMTPGGSALDDLHLDDLHLDDLRPNDLHLDDLRLNDLRLDDLYRAEHSLLQGCAVVPLFHLPLATAAGQRVHDWAADPLAQWSTPRHSLAGLWLDNSRLDNSRSDNSRPDNSQPMAGPR